MPEEIRRTVAGVLHEMAVTERAELPADGTPLGAHGLGLESLFLMQLISRLETRYAIAFPMDLGVVLTWTVGDLVTFVAGQATVSDQEK